MNGFTDGQQKTLSPCSMLSPILLLQGPSSPPLNLSKGLQEGVTDPVGALRRKSSLFLSKTDYLFWKTCVCPHTPQVCFLSNLILPLGWEVGLE